MNILFNFINHATAIDKQDYRIAVFQPLLYLLRDIGHQIWIDPHKKSGHPSFKPFKELLKDFPTFSNKHVKDVQLWIVPYPHAKKKSKYLYLRKRKTPILMYEHGWLNQSTFVDRGEMFSDSYFTDSISDMIDKDFSAKQCQKYQKNVLASNVSKRPQTGSWDAPKNINGKYIFVPIQKINDVSMVQYSKTGMLDFIAEVSKFAKQKKIEVVVKQHPHTKEDHETIRRHIKK